MTMTGKNFPFIIFYFHLLILLFFLNPTKRLTERNLMDLMNWNERVDTRVRVIPAKYLFSRFEVPIRVVHGQVKKLFTVRPRDIIETEKSSLNEEVTVPIRIMCADDGVNQAIADSKPFPHPIRPESIFIVASDVCLLLEIRQSNTSKTIGQFAAHEKRLMKVSLSIGSKNVTTPMNVLSIRGIERLILSCRILSKAKPVVRAAKFLSDTINELCGTTTVQFTVRDCILDAYESLEKKLLKEDETKLQNSEPKVLDDETETTHDASIVQLIDTQTTSTSTIIQETIHKPEITTRRKRKLDGIDLILSVSQEMEKQQKTTMPPVTNVQTPSLLTPFSLVPSMYSPETYHELLYAMYYQIFQARFFGISR